MTGSKGDLKWLAWAVPAGLSLVFALVPLPQADLGMLVLPVIAVMLLLPLVTAVTAVRCAPAVPCAASLLAATAGWKVFPAAALPTVLLWCAACALTACLPMKRRLLRPSLRAAMCLAAWCAGLVTLYRITGGQIVNGLAQAACDYVDADANSTEWLLRAYSAGYIRLQGTEALAPAVRIMGSIVISPEVRTQMLLTLRVSIEDMLPSLLCSAVVYHTALTTLLCTVVPDWLRRRKGERGEFPPLEQWYMPRRLGAAVFALCLGWVIALVAEGGAGAYLGWLCANVFRVAFILQGICWLQWMGKRMGIRSVARNAWSVLLSVVIPLIPMVMGMIDQRRDARHLRPEKEAEQE